MRVLIVGLGRAAALTIETLEGRADASVVAGVDPEPSAPLPAGSPVYARLADVPAGTAVDVAIVATPTPTHVDVCRELLDGPLRPPTILCEKPLAPTLAPVRDLLERAAAGGVHLRVLYHYAHAPEVLWARGQWEALVERHGPATGFEACFVDPLSHADRAHVLVSPWVDSGINALSVLARFVELPDDAAATGRVVTRWAGDEETKWTRLELADGAAVTLDHPTQTAIVGNEIRFRGTGRAPHARYRNLLDAHLRGDATVCGDEVTLRLHELLEWGCGDVT